MLDRRLVVIAGKGGVGRSTVALATALAIAGEGRSVALVEVHGARALAGAFGVVPRGARPERVAPGLDLLSIDAPACLSAYAADRRAVAPLAGAVFGNRIVRAFLDAVPGMADLLHLGLIHSLLVQGIADRPPYDTVVIDAPPTGHGVAFTGTARAMVEMTRRGPIHDEALLIADLLDDPARSAQLVVTLPESLAVSETLELLAALGPQRDTVAAVVVNRVEPDPFGGGLPWSEVRGHLEGRDPALCAVGDRLVERLVHQRDALARLTSVDLPGVALPDAPGRVGPDRCAPLVDALRQGVP